MSGTCWRTMAVSAVLAAALLAGCGGSDDEPPPMAGEHLIVSVGDSVASGEGSPGEDPRWLRPQRCHRSTDNAHRFAAEQLIAANPDAHLRFVSYACSGARITKGLLDKFRPFVRAERPQLARVDDLTPPAEVDALLISIGANDVGFSKIVQFCIFHEPCQDDTGFGLARDFAREHHLPRLTLDDYVQRRVEKLRDDYRQVNDAIPPEIPRDRVFIVEYFDPTRAPADTQCAIFRKLLSEHPEEGRVSVRETTWAHDHLLLRLNAAIAQTESDFGWTVVGGVDEDFDGHGVCAEKLDRWANTIFDSEHVQRDHRGTLHPNETGHRATAALIVPVLADELDLEVD